MDLIRHAARTPPIQRRLTIFCRSLSACRRPLHCRLVESEKPTASPQRSPETQIDHRPDGLRRRLPCCFSVASWSLRTRRHGVISDFAVAICSFLLLPSFNADNDAPPGALCTVSVTLLAAGIGLVCDGDVAL